ncbi:hypothetical protein [Sinorhizobium meliloti]|uniref:hypothetical protein n=1 Tax=Rhizobium meliloti TaxID=382 RepID=UPI0013E353B2|nr:hypothetical protein [Sinorhizobium meliloti]
MTNEISGHPALSRTMQGGEMLQADEVVAMLRLHALGWGAGEAIARPLARDTCCGSTMISRSLDLNPI